MSLLTEVITIVLCLIGTLWAVYRGFINGRRAGEE
jgi:hypothetical protein